MGELSQEKKSAFFHRQGVLSLEEAWEVINLVMNPDVSPKYRGEFEKKYNYILENSNLLAKRKEFYLKILGGNKGIIKQYKNELGKHYLERVSTALENTKFKERKLITELKEQVINFPSKCLERELTDFEFKNPLTNWTDFSKCKLTGICSCDGKNPPYMKGCVKDDSLIAKSHQQIRKETKTKLVSLAEIFGMHRE